MATIGTVVRVDKDGTRWVNAPCGACIGTGVNLHNEPCVTCKGSKTQVITTEQARVRNQTPRGASRGRSPSLPANPALNSARVELGEEDKDGRTTWHDVGGIRNIALSRERSAAERIASQWGGYSGLQSTAYEVELTFDDLGNHAQTTLLDSGYGGRTFKLAIEMDGKRSEMSAFVTSFSSTMEPAHNSVVELKLRAMDTKDMPPSRRQPSVDDFAPFDDFIAEVPKELPAAQALMSAPDVCHVCGEPTVVKGVDGRPEHPTCGAWGRA